MEYKSNLSQVLVDIEERLKKASDVSKLERTIATYLLASNLRRIHNEGKDVNGKKIGSYSIKPLYVNPKYSPKKFATKGKNGDETFKSGKKHKTGYFKGWKGFRQAISRETSYVNLELSGKLRLSLVMQQDGNRFLIGFNSKYGSKISQGQEEHFNKNIWGVSKDDKEQINVISEQFINKQLGK